MNQQVNNEGMVTQAELNMAVNAAITEMRRITKDDVFAKQAENRRLRYEAEKVFASASKNYYTDIVIRFSVCKNYHMAGGEPTPDGHSIDIFRMIMKLALALVGATSPIDAARNGVGDEANYYAEMICEAILKNEKTN